jgi:hypothetical protein
VCSSLAVDPTVAEGDVKRFGVGDGLYAGGLFGELDPEAGGGGVVLGEPGVEGVGGGEPSRVVGSTA